jgi:hypothetical protein
MAHINELKLLEWQRDEEAHSYLLHPVTLEVYRMPKASLEHDARVPVPMEFDVFEDMAGVGCLSAERFLNHERMVPTGFTAAQILAVRLTMDRGTIGNGKLYAWASRMTTSVPPTSLLPPELHGQPVGHEFVWLWPPGKAWNAFITRKERQRLDPDERVAGIDMAEPSVRYTMARPGLMLGPEDVAGCERVDPSELTPLQRFFVASIRPQQTLFSRRPSTEDWTQRVTKMTDENQRRLQAVAADEAHVLLHQDKAVLGSGVVVSGGERGREVLRRAAMRDRREALTSAYLDNMLFNKNKHGDLQPLEPSTIKRRRVRAFSEFEQAHGSSDIVKRLFAPMQPQKRVRVLGPDADLEGIAKRTHALSARATELWDKFQRGHVALRNVRWGSLPDELFVRIVCIRVGEDLAATAAEARSSVCALRAVSRGTCAVVDRFVGAQLHRLEDQMHVALWGTEPGVLTPADAGAKARALGMSPEDALRLNLRQRKLAAPSATVDSIPAMMLPKCPDIVPDWIAYFKRRAWRETVHGARSVPVKPRERPCSGFLSIVNNLRALNPSVNNQRFAGIVREAEARDGALRLPDPRLDEAMLAAGDVDIREQMLEVACV